MKYPEEWQQEPKAMSLLRHQSSSIFTLEQVDLKCMYVSE